MHGDVIGELERAFFTVLSNAVRGFLSSVLLKGLKESSSDKEKFNIPRDN